MYKFILRTVFLFLVCSAPGSFADESVVNPESTKIERIGGNFVVSKIQAIDDGGFRVEFTATSEKPIVKKLVLDSPHVHVSVNLGQELRLSADISEFKDGVAKVNQMVLFLNSRAGTTPVWLLSKNYKGMSPPAKLLEMHVPSTDFQIL